MTPNLTLIKLLILVSLKLMTNVKAGCFAPPEYCFHHDALDCLNKVVKSTC